MSFELYDFMEFRKYTLKSEVDKAIHVLEGLMKGIAIDGKVNFTEVVELQNWMDLHENLLAKHPFSELASLLTEVLVDQYITKEEKADILWFCSNLTSPEGLYYNIITSDIQRLHGLFHGIMADGKIELKEVQELEEWLSENDHLSGSYPYDEICSLITFVLKDGQLSPEEIALLKVFFSEFIDLRKSYNLSSQEINALKTSITFSGICSVCPNIVISDRLFCFTGKSSKATRAEIKNQVESLGGFFKDTVTKGTHYLVVGNEGNPCWAFSCYGRKVEQAVELRKSGHSIIIVHENDFWDEIR